MKKKGWIFCLFLLLVSLSSCKKIQLEEKEYWQGSVEDDFEDNKIMVTIDKNFSNREFTVEDFKEIEAVECRKRSYSETDGDESFIRNYYTIVLGVHSKQNVIDCIRIIQEYDFVQCAWVSGYDYPDNLCN